jgi:polysaccharide pyruvyl transferase WcaK-like protein
MSGIEGADVPAATGPDPDGRAGADPGPCFPVPLGSITNAASILCPDNLCRALRAALPGRPVIPFCAGPTVAVGQVGAVVLHKPSMHRLDFGLLAEIAARFTPTYADAVYVVYRRGGGAGTLAPEMALHLGIVEHHLRNVPLPAPGAPRRRRALVVSAHGAGNIGDDAVSLAAAQMAGCVGFQEVELSGPAWSPQQVDAADLVVVGGGGLLYDVHHLGEPDIENVGNYTAPLLRARLMGKATAGLGLGTQSIATTLGQRVFGHALRAADLLTVRDEGDVAELRDQVGFTGARLTADLAFALRALERPGTLPPVPVPLANDGPTGRPLAIVALPGTIAHVFSGPDGLAGYGAALLRALEDTHEVLVAQHSTDDAELCASLRRSTGVKVQRLDRLGVRAALALYRAASLVVTGRYHGIVFAALGGASRVVAMGRESTKIGRLIRHDLPSLRDARLDPSELGRTVPAEVLGRAAQPAAAEVRRLEVRALQNIGLLDAALGARGARNPGV